MGVKLIAYREDGWMAPNTDFRQWDHLARAYGADLQMVNDWSEAKIPDGYTVVVVDEEGDIDVSEYSHPTDAVYVFGRSGMDIRKIDHDKAIRIDTPNTISLFGISAGSIVLYSRES